MRYRELIGIVLALATFATPAAAQSQSDAIRILREVAAECPRAYRNAHADHNTHPERLDYIILATKRLKAFDPRWGMNGKRGNPNDPSADAIAYGVGRDVRVFDVIAAAGAHGNNLDAIYWNDVTGVGGAGAIYVDPDQHQPRVPCGAPSTTPPPTADFWTAAHQGIVAKMAGSNTERIAQQLRASFPAEEWGQKRADGSRPKSGDVIALRAGGRLRGVRVVPSSAGPLGPIGDITGQVFEPVNAVDHLGIGQPAPPPVNPEPPPTPPTEPTPPPAGTDEIRAALAAMAADLAAMREDIAKQRQELIDAVKGQAYDIDVSAGPLGRVRGQIKPRK